MTDLVYKADLSAARLRLQKHQQRQWAVPAQAYDPVWSHVTQVRLEAPGSCWTSSHIHSYYTSSYDNVFLVVFIVFLPAMLFCSVYTPGAERSLKSQCETHQVKIVIYDTE